MDKKLEMILSKVQKPSRYTGGEFGAVAKNADADVLVRYGFCFPDTYEIGMSHMGMKILYGLLNSLEYCRCERVFAPETDMEGLMRRENLPLYALESGDPIKDFDFLGFTLQYELCYTNVLNMLDMAGIPLCAADRSDDFPIIMAGGPCAVNGEPIADFIDMFVIGEAEEALVEILDLYAGMKKKSENERVDKSAFLKAACAIQGVYVPSFYRVDYEADGRVKAIVPLYDCVPQKVERRIVRDLDKAYYPDDTVVPYGEIVHDRVMLELFRGCIRGCRFCQAGMIYRPVREKSLETVRSQGKALCENTGYEEMSLSSLSSSDYTHIIGLLDEFSQWTDERSINLTLPSLRLDNFPPELMKKLQRARKSGLTFAPEAGSQRLRDVINKNISKDEILATATQAFIGGNTSVKLYFMLGLPTETDEDVTEIPALAKEIADCYFNVQNRNKNRPMSIGISAANFVPKPFTPFQWFGQDSIEEFKRKHSLVKSLITSKKISYKWHDAQTSFLEAIFARGDRRIGKVILRAYKAGCKMDAWEEHLKYDVWMESFEKEGLNPAFYASRHRDYNEVLPWSYIDMGFSDEYLKREYELAKKGLTTPDCKTSCAGCGIKDCAIKDGKLIGEAEKYVVSANANGAGEGSSEREETPPAELQKLRIKFRRDEKAGYISHLDQNRAMIRTFNRSGLPLWHTQGFNPHPHIVFAIPLSVGFKSECELMDVRMKHDCNTDEAKAELAKVIPQGFEVLTVYEPNRKFADICCAEYKIEISGDIPNPEKIDELFNVNDSEIFVLKVSKKGEKETNIRPMIKAIRLEESGDGMFIITAMCDSSSASFLNPEYIVKAIERYAPGVYVRNKSFTRVEIYDKDMKIFK